MTISSCDQHLICFLYILTINRGISSISLLFGEMLQPPSVILTASAPAQTILIVPSRSIAEYFCRRIASLEPLDSGKYFSKNTRLFVFVSTPCLQPYSVRGVTFSRLRRDTGHWKSKLFLSQMFSFFGEALQRPANADWVRRRASGILTWVPTLLTAALKKWFMSSLTFSGPRGCEKAATSKEPAKT